MDCYEISKPELLFSEINTNVENTKQLKKDLTEERSRYQSLLSEHLHLQELHKELKEEMNLSIVRNISLESQC